MRILLAKLYSTGARRIRLCSTIAQDGAEIVNGKSFIRIGNVKAKVNVPKSAELVPKGYVSMQNSQMTLSHLKWLLQKDILKQDVFLIGVPGSLRTSLVLQYLEATNRECEFITITRDSTEADIKQRREIRDSSAIYTDLAAVRAALNGRVLIIDGVEKAERNVLPILNNLLENREMQLDDGRFLMQPSKYDKLLEKYSREELKAMGVLRVSDEFHVIALGLPVPRFAGHTLDPPLRSRFQCRNVTDVSFEECVNECRRVAPNVDQSAINDLVALAYALNSQQDLEIPRVPVDNISHAMRVWSANPGYSSEFIFRLVYPMDSILKDNELNLVKEFLTKFGVKNDSSSSVVGIKSVTRNDGASNVTLSTSKKDVTVATDVDGVVSSHQREFVPTSSHERLLANLAIAHSQGDFVLLGPKGSGKSVIIEQLSRRLGFSTETMVLYQDMNAREFLQRRRMLDNGDTVWEDSQLIEAAKKGSVCVLDGAERVHKSALESISSLLHHRRLDLPGGGRLLKADEFDRIAIESSISAAELNAKGIFKIPKSFRVIIVGDSELGEHKWINEAVNSLSVFYSIPDVSVADQNQIIGSLVNKSSQDTVAKLIDFVQTLRSSHDAGLRGVALSLSLRKLIHIAKRDALHPGELRSLIEKAALARFLPSITKTAFTNALDKAGIKNRAEASGEAVEEDLKALRRETIENASDETMIPDVLYYDNAQHTAVMRDMARDMRLGAHLLLIGNQGVGKNKITDRFLHLINRPRQYMQLHRDTTVETLTMQTTVEGGKLRHEDSALVRAARAGHILVVDEADKAPLHVIAVLKSLLDSNTLLLGDGRRIQSASLPQNENTIALHPEFRIIMLANRPGFPFLGNDLFGVLGDLFAVHTVDNPSRESEMKMLRKYAPDLPEANLAKLVAAFTDLRQMADDGHLQYPYSTRELVNIVKHANAFPDDSLTSVVRNVFDFDQFSEDSMKTIEEIFQKHGIPLGVTPTKDRIFISHRHLIDEPKTVGEWGVRDNVAPTSVLANVVQLAKGKRRQLEARQSELKKEHMRSAQFTEQECSWQIPMIDVNIVSDAVFTRNQDSLAVAAVNPSRLYIINHLLVASEVSELDISDFVAAGRTRSQFNPRIRLCPYNDSQILLHEETSNSLCLIDLHSHTLTPIDTSFSLLEKGISKFMGDSHNWRLLPAPRPTLYERGGKRLLIFNNDDTVVQLELPIQFEAIFHVADNRFLIKTESSMMLLSNENGKWRLRDVDVSSKELDVNALNVVESLAHIGDDHHYSLMSDGFPTLLSKTEVVGSKRKPLTAVVDDRRPYYLSDKNTKKNVDDNRNLIVMEDGIIVRALPKWQVPKEAIRDDISQYRVAGFLEVVDPKNRYVQYVPVPEPVHQSYHGTWLASISRTPFIIVPWSETRMLTVDTNGGIRSYELSMATLGKSFEAWKKMLGDSDGQLRMEFDKNDFDMSKLDQPKLGKFDPDNAPHHGGNTWMGGTGGYNTAGLGGVGGPFRLDAGHDVHQQSDFAKQQVPEHILRKAREIAKAEYAKKLKEIKMSEYDDDAYQKLWRTVDKQSSRLRGIIESLEAKKKERQWTRHQTSGDLDDGKLIEAVTGEKNIYRRRVDKLPEPGSPQVKPKRLRMCFDVSGSMYRFNGYDSRLKKSMEAALMVMTAFEGKQDKVQYDLVGHSGDGPCTYFIRNGHYPKNNKDRIDILKEMVAHTQFCASGDFTVEAISCAVKDLAKEAECDEKLVVLISDANLERYGIRPKDVIREMNKDENVNCFVVFIGSLGEQAEKLQRTLPAGKAFVCKESSELPKIMQSILASTLV